MEDCLTHISSPSLLPSLPLSLPPSCTSGCGNTVPHAQVQRHGHPCALRRGRYREKMLRRYISSHHTSFSLLPPPLFFPSGAAVLLWHGRFDAQLQVCAVLRCMLLGLVLIPPFSQVKRGQTQCNRSYVQVSGCRTGVSGPGMPSLPRPPLACSSHHGYLKECREE